MVGNTNAGSNMAYSNLDLGGKQTMKIIVQGVELYVIAIWMDIALLEGWNSITPYVVCWNLEAKDGEYRWGGAHYYSNKFSAKADWKEKSEVWDM
ncbi:MAG: hypothetical protein FD179_986 [Erysipelotrichaceae bacterium]|nr:MAG: hypothetical protein FD179_986 [Erysipelotrichaceae bacterium]